MRPERPHALSQLARPKARRYQPQASNDRLEIERILHRKPGYMIRRLQQMAISIFMDETSDFDITPVQYATLAAVSLYPGIDQLRVANAIGIDRVTIGGVIERLASKNLLKRAVSGRDRRANELTLTAGGLHLLAEMEDATKRVEDRILEPLSRKERDVFLMCLDQLVISHNQASRVPINRALLTGNKKGQRQRAGHMSTGRLKNR
jgi:MarR family transcriptional regulator, lower aerobic nicotinate degradation pathway regulator